jgi:two-component system cell cycle response regulator
MKSVGTIQFVNDGSNDAVCLRSALRGLSGRFEITDQLAGTISQEVTCVITRLAAIERSIGLLRDLRARHYEGAVVFYSSADVPEAHQAVLAAGAQEVLVPSVDSPQTMRRAILHAMVRQQSQSELAELSLRDDLTGLRNRRGFVTLAEQQLRIAERSWQHLAVFFMDVDNMKPINDRFGHETGNVALCDTASILANTFRVSDIVARIGGDEFAALVTDISFDAAESITTRLQSEFQIFNARRSRPFTLSMSIGFTIYDPAQPKTVDRLLANADAEMYQVKRNAKQGLLAFIPASE